MSDVMLVAPQDGCSNVYIRRAFEECGMTVTDFDYRGLGIRSGWKAMNLRLVEVAANHKLVLVLKGETIEPRTLRRLRERGAEVAIWHFDPRDGMEKWVMERARETDWFFTIAQGLVPHYQKNGIRARWLLEACDPAMHKPFPLAADEPTYPVSFIGTIGEVPDREKWLLELRDRFKNDLVLFGSLPGALAGPRHYGRAEEAMAYRGDAGWCRAVARSSVNLGRDRNPEIAGSFGARLFRTLAAGGFLLTNRTRGIEDMDFFHGIGVYTSTEDCIEKVLASLEDPDGRKDMAARGREIVLKNHTFKNRVWDMMRMVDAG